MEKRDIQTKYWPSGSGKTPLVHVTEASVNTIRVVGKGSILRKCVGLLASGQADNEVVSCIKLVMHVSWKLYVITGGLGEGMLHPYEHATGTRYGEGDATQQT